MTIIVFYPGDLYNGCSCSYLYQLSVFSQILLMSVVVGHSSHAVCPTSDTAHLHCSSKNIINWASSRENLSSGVCEQHRRRPACASAQSDQRLCYSLFGKFHM